MNEKSGYDTWFDGWNIPSSIVTGNMTITANFARSGIMYQAYIGINVISGDGANLSISSPVGDEYYYYRNDYGYVYLLESGATMTISNNQLSFYNGDVLVAVVTANDGHNVYGTPAKFSVWQFDTSSNYGYTGGSLTVEEDVYIYATYGGTWIQRSLATIDNCYEKDSTIVDTNITKICSVQESEKISASYSEVWLDDKFRKLQEQQETEIDFEGVNLYT